MWLSGRGIRVSRFTLLLLITTIFCHISPPGYPLAAAQLSQNHNSAVSSPQEAYERALQLLRSTLAHSQQYTSQSYEQRDSSASEKLSDSQTNTESGLHLYWHLIRRWIPFTGIYKDLARLKNVFGPLNGNVRNKDIHSLTSKWTSTAKAGKSPWDGTALLASTDGSRDPAEEEQARKYTGARPEQLWPEWDGGDVAYFGPFLASSRDDSLDALLGHRQHLPLLGSNLTSWNTFSFPTSSSKQQRRQEQRLEADKRREEAIALLTWAAGWTDAEDILDKEKMLLAASQVNWKEEAKSQTHLSTSQTYVENFLLSKSSGGGPVGRPSADALWVLAHHSLWGTHGAVPQPARAKACFERLAALNGNASAHNYLGWIEGGAWGKEGWSLVGVEEPGYDTSEETRQAKALLHYTASARQNDTSAQIALAYRYQAGIGVRESCGASLYWYEKAAADAISRFQSGPPGGLTLPYTHMRLSDISGGVFGPGSSAASTGMAMFRPAIQAMMHSLPADGSSGGRRLDDLLEFFTYHAQRGAASYALRLARIYYGGSVLGTSESAARVPRDYKKAREYLIKIASEVWPTDPAQVRRGGPTISIAKQGQRGEDVKHKVDDALAAHAGMAAGLLGQMYLRGEGVTRSYAKAWVWLSRGAEQGDAESYNGLGVIYQQGLGVDKNMKKAAEYFEASASQAPRPSAEGCINLAKMHLAMNELIPAAKYFEMAMKLSSSFEAYYYLAVINLRLGRFTLEDNGEGYRVGTPGMASYERCHNAVNGFKLAVERADWRDATFSRAERAWSKGLRGHAIQGWAIAGERGYEAAQNNVAWILDRDKRRLQLERWDAPQSNATDRLALIHWIRSAAQDNVDALVKMGDYYYYGFGVGEAQSSPTSTIFSSPSRNKGPSVSYDKAAACYSAAAERQGSALAYWNMGFMYERGLGVPKKDYNLAKRYYDMALDLNPSEAYFPVLLSLAKLIIMACWDALRNKDTTALSLLNSLAHSPTGRSRVFGAMSGGLFDNPDMPYTEADEIRLRQEENELASMQAAEEIRHDGDIGDLNLPETYDRRSQGTQDYADDMEDLDSTIEGLLIVVGFAALAMLIYARQGVQMRVDRQRRENQEQQRAEDEAEHDVQPAAYPEGPPQVDANQPFGWPLQDGNAYAGL